MATLVENSTSQSDNEVTIILTVTITMILITIATIATIMYLFFTHNYGCNYYEITKTVCCVIYLQPNLTYKEKISTVIMSIIDTSVILNIMVSIALLTIHILFIKADFIITLIITIIITVLTTIVLFTTAISITTIITSPCN